MATVSIFSEMLFYMVYNLRQRKYILSLGKHRAAEIIESLHLVDDYEEYFNKLKQSK